MKARILKAMFGVCLVGAVAVPSAAGATGDLTQKPGLAGCISGDGDPCVQGTALRGAVSVTVSPDGKSAYVASFFGASVSVFDRAADGTLTQKLGTAGCISNTGTGGSCVTGTALSFANSVTVSPDGKSAYVASQGSGAVAVFDRAADGVLTQKPGMAGCISDTGTGGACGDGTALAGAISVTVSPDGKSAYVASASGGAVAIFDRASDGTLTQKPGTAGCITNAATAGCTTGKALDSPRSVSVSPDGTSVYVVSNASSAVAVFDRSADGSLTQKPGLAGCISKDGAGPCDVGKGLAEALSVTVSPDGKSVYTTSDIVVGGSAVAVFDRAADGTLTQKPGTAGCVNDGQTGGCVVVRGFFDGANAVTVSPDGKSVYVAGFYAHAVAILDRAADGTLTQKPDTAACISDSGGGPCFDGTQALDGPRSVTVSPDGKSVYLAGFGNGGTVAVLDRVPVPPDSDNDGVPDASDACPSQAGPASNAGCPVAVTPPVTPPGVSPPPPGGGFTSDISAPAVSSYGLTNNPFVVGGGSTPTFGSAAAKRHKKGTTFRYTMSEAGTVRVVISQRRPGRRKGKRCVAPTRKLRKAKKCTRISAKGTLTRSSHQGANTVAFSGRIGSKALSPGSYQATLTATDNAKNTSRGKTIFFTIVKR